MKEYLGASRGLWEARLMWRTGQGSEVSKRLLSETAQRSATQEDAERRRAVPKLSLSLSLSLSMDRTERFSGMITTETHNLEAH
ncbi:hypothetical protein IRJ41_020411, partial [Triplophysa rosa]